jgi:hypothetical protein
LTGLQKANVLRPTGNAFGARAPTGAAKLAARVLESLRRTTPHAIHAGLAGQTAAGQAHRVAAAFTRTVTAATRIATGCITAASTDTARRSTATARAIFTRHGGALGATLRLFAAGLIATLRFVTATGLAT